MMHGWMDTWMYEQMDGWTGWMEGKWKNRQKEPQFLVVSVFFQLLLITWPKM
jgi:hypothetical protein